MRSGILIFLVSSAFTPACTDSATEPPDSVRDQLTSSAVQLIVARDERAGSITAQRRAARGWIEGSVELTVRGGELVAAADARGAIRIERFAIDLGTIELPESLLGYAARLTRVRLETEPLTGIATMWRSDDEVRAMAPVQLELSWSLTIEGETSPLGAPSLLPVPVELRITGDGTAIHAQARARASGEIWSWADLLKLKDLDLSLTASATATASASAAISTTASPVAL